MINLRIQALQPIMQYLFIRGAKVSGRSGCANESARIWPGALASRWRWGAEGLAPHN